MGAVGIFPSSNPTAPLRHPYTAAQVAALLGHSLDWFYAHYERLVQDGMPPRLTSFGRYRFHAAAIDAWLSARERMRTAPGDLATQATIEAERAALAAEYGAPR